MYLHTTYKAFVAKAAAGLMQEMVADALAKGYIDNQKSWNENESTYEFLSWQAASAAETLAKTLSDKWNDGQTVFFDPQDSLTSRLENTVFDVAEKIQELTERLKLAK